MGLEWNPENRFFLEHFDGIHRYDLTMNLEERISTRSFKCKEMKVSNPYQCLEKYQMEKLNCSFPWHKNSINGLKPCTGKEDVTNFQKLVAKLRDYTSFERVELSNLDCWVPKCNKTSWKRITDYHSPSNDSGFKFYIYSISGVCNNTN